MKKKLSILVALLLCFAMLAGCASNAEAPADDQTDDTATSDTTSDDGAASGDPIKIGMVAPVTGTSAMVGEYMENGCKMKPKYVERVEDFYQFDDHNNCERIYNEIIKYQQQVNKDKLK